MDLLALKGTYAYATGDAARAGTFLSTALPKYLALGSPGNLGPRIHRTLGHIAYDQGDYQTALGRYRSLLEIHQRSSPLNAQSIGRAHYNIGNCFWGMDQRDSCKAHYTMALSLWNNGNADKNPVIGYIHEVLGTYAWETGDERGALDHFNRAAAHQLKQADGQDAADRSVEAAEGEAAQGHMAAALQRYEEALVFRTKNYGADHPNTACMHSDIARMLMAMDRPEEAMARVQQAIMRFLPGFTPADAWSNPPNIDGATSHRLLLDALFLKFRLLSDRGMDARNARACDEVIDLALSTIEHLRIGAASEGSKLFWTTQVRGSFETAIDHCHERFVADRDPRAIERALTIMEMSKNALLAEAMRSLDALSTGGLPHELADEERTLKLRIAEMQRYILLEEKKCERMDADKVGLWKKAVAADEADLGLLVERIRTQYPAYHDLKYGSAKVQLPELKQRLGSQRSLLCMFQGSAACYFILFDTRGAQFVKDERVGSIEQALIHLRELLADRERSLTEPERSYADFTEHASSLYESIFGSFASPPLEDLVIMPDGPFQYLPFEVLLTRAPANGKRNYRTLPYLIREHVVQYIPMIRTWRHDRPVQIGAAGYLGVAARYEAGGANGLAPLRYNEQEVEATRSMLGGNALIGATATEQNFKDQAPQAQVIHLALHTTIDDVDPLYTALAFGSADPVDDGVLNMYELFGMELHARLAVLSACRTGDGKMLHGEGAMSMARAFAHAGCSSMVMSLWNCEDEATRTIITDFFAAAKDGETLDRALRNAKLHYLDNCDPLKAHPYYWSTLELVGDERAMDLDPPWYQRTWVWVLGASLLLLALVGSRIRKVI